MMRRINWAATPLGPPDCWPQTLQTAVRIMLNSRCAMWMAWGPELTFLCNDAYLPSVGIKRDWVLGSCLDKVSDEIWPDISPRIRHVLTTGEATWDQSLLLFIERMGLVEETYQAFSYSPLSDEDGRVLGVLCVVTEVTARTIGERRWSSLSQLSAVLATARAEPEMLLAAERGLQAAAKDIPFGLLYLYDEQGQLRLARAIGLPAGHGAAPETLAQGHPWPLTSGLVALGDRFGELPKAPWNRPPEAAVVMPISRLGQLQPAGLLVAALNPHLHYDSNYANFIELVAAQLATAVATARVFEEEHRQANALAKIERTKPLSDVSQEAKTPLTPTLGPSEPGEPVLEGYVLVADDDPDMRAYMRKLLGSHWEVEVTENGALALQLIRQRKPDLVVTAATMPVLDGFGFLKAIRKDPELNDLPIIMLSARADEESRIEGFEAGADYYLTKPFSGRELVAQINTNLKLSHLRQETTRRLHESAMELQQRAAQYKTLLNTAPVGVYLVDADGRVVEVNRTANLTFKVKASYLGHDFDEAVHIVWNKQFADEVVRRLRHTLNTGEPYISSEISEYRADLALIESYEWQLHRIPMPDGRFGVICYFRDISAQVRARAERELLINELNHRVKNTLATIQSVTAQTLAGAGVDRAVHEALEARLITMAGAHDVLTQRNWDCADLHEIVSKALGPFADTHKMKVNGPSVNVGPGAALAIAMAVHELATNAIKYGSLSGNGQVAVSWRLDDPGDRNEPWLHIEWVESGGPPVDKPVRKGFGSRLIGRGLAGQLSGEASIEYASAGVICRIRAPLSSVSGAPVQVSS